MLHTEYFQLLPLWYIYYSAGRRARLCWNNCSLTQTKVHSNTLPSNSNTLYSHHSLSQDRDHSKIQDNYPHSLLSRLRKLHSTHSYFQTRHSFKDSNLFQYYSTSQSNILKSQADHSNLLQIHSLHSNSPQIDHAVHSNTQNSRWRLAMLCALHAHIVAPALCVLVVTAFKDSGVDYRVVKGMLLASAGGPCGWLSLAFSGSDIRHKYKCTHCDMNRNSKGIKTESYCDTRPDGEKIYRRGHENVNDDFNEDSKSYCKDMYSVNVRNDSDDTKRLINNNDKLKSSLNNKQSGEIFARNIRVRDDSEDFEKNSIYDSGNNEHDICGVLTPLLLLANYVSAIVAVPALKIVICGRGTLPHFGGIFSDALITFPPFILGMLVTSPPRCRCSKKNVVNCGGHLALNINENDMGAILSNTNLKHGNSNKRNGFVNERELVSKKSNNDANVINKDGINTVNVNIESKKEDNNTDFIGNDTDGKCKYEITNESHTVNIICDPTEQMNSASLNHENNIDSTVKSFNGIRSNGYAVKPEKNNYNPHTIAYTKNMYDITSVTNNTNSIFDKAAQTRPNKSDKTGDFPKIINDTVVKREDTLDSETVVLDGTDRGIISSSRETDDSGDATDCSSVISDAVVSRLCGLMLVYCECCDRLREAEGSLYVGDVLLTLVLAVSWVTASACVCRVYSRSSRGLGGAGGRQLLVCALPKCFHAGWEASTRCSPSGMSLLPAAFLAPAQALLLAALITHASPV